MLPPRTLVMSVALLVACPRASSLAMRGTRLAITHSAVCTATNSVASPVRLQRPVAMIGVSAPFVAVRKHVLGPFVAGAVIRGLFELLAEIEGRSGRWWPVALRSGRAKWWPRIARIAARWTCVAACLSLVDDYMLGAVGLVLGFLGSDRLMLQRAGWSAGPGAVGRPGPDCEE